MEQTDPVHVGRDTVDVILCLSPCVTSRGTWGQFVPLLGVFTLIIWGSAAHCQVSLPVFPPLKWGPWIPTLRVATRIDWDDRVICPIRDRHSGAVGVTAPFPGHYGTKWVQES